jgi:hypothetical protein
MEKAMSDNPLDNDPARDALIRERAYHLWDAEGRPEGRDLDYWERARELVGMEANPEAGQLPNPIALGIDPSAPTDVEEASIQENLGEFPGALTDQGDEQQTPMAKKSRKTKKDTSKKG